LSAPVVRSDGNGDSAERLPVPSRGSDAEQWRVTALRLSALYVDAESRFIAELEEAERLHRRVRELESWLQHTARYDEIEHVQLGRLLALDSAQREERRLPLFASTRALLLFVYAGAALALALLMVMPQLWP
jgi:hypothetical protein